MSVERLQRLQWKRADPRWRFGVASVASPAKLASSLKLHSGLLPACASFSVVRLRASETCNVEGGVCRGLLMDLVCARLASAISSCMPDGLYLDNPPLVQDIHGSMSCYFTSAARLLLSDIWWAMWREHPPPHSVPYLTFSISGQLQVATYRTAPA